MTKTEDRMYEQSRKIVSACSGILHGHDVTVQGAALADLLAMFIAGHQAGAETDTLREDILRLHIDHVRALIPINAELLEKCLKLGKAKVHLRGGLQ